MNTDVFPLIIPELILAAAACVLFLGATFRADRHLWALISLLSLVLAGLALYFGPAISSGSDSATVALDRVGLLVKAIALGAGVLLVLFSWDDVPDSQAGEYYACLLLIIAGLSLTGVANDLITLFLALELISIPTYVLLYLPRADNAAREAAMKYFLLSIFSSALLLFGFSYLYGLSGTTSLPGLFDVLSRAVEGRPGEEGVPSMLYVAQVMVIAGLGFRIAAVPFHFYAPDVYQGTPTVAAAMLAVVPKVAGFVALMRVLGYVGVGHPGQVLGVPVPMIFYILAAVTMSLGNMLALLQDNLKRMLAYSSVAHAGYMLVGLASAPYFKTGLNADGTAAVLFYLVAYGAMTIGAFQVLSYLSTPQQPVENVDDLAGLSVSHPGVALLMGIFLFSLIGIPPTGGFWGKLLLIFGALGANLGAMSPSDHPWLYGSLALVVAINAAVGGWYYLRILAVMYLRTPIRPLARPRSWPGLVTLWLCAAITLGLAYPRPLLDVIKQAVSSQVASGGQEAPGPSDQRAAAAP